MDEEKPKIRWQAVALAVVWATLLIFAAWVVPSFRQMYDEMAYGTAGVPLPLATRAVVGVPTALWIVLAPIVAGALVLKSKLVSRKKAGLIDRVALWSLGALIAAIAFALFMPITGVLMERIQP